MTSGYQVDNGTIVINRELNDLDLFVREFLDVLKKHSKYLIVSGYISISTGRVRGTEDVDILIPLQTKEEFEKLFDDLTKAGFWCYQTDSKGEAYNHFRGLSSIRFAKKDQMFPNIEAIPVTEMKHAQWFELGHPQKYKVKDFEFLGSPLEFEITYKEQRLKGQKDLEDARHLRTMFKSIIDEEKLKTFKKMFSTWHE
ncbi:MAG: hypothetical protein ABIA93_01500 [Candidatus Woesearchaeota archaeon]